MLCIGRQHLLWLLSWHKAWRTCSTNIKMLKLQKCYIQLIKSYNQQAVMFRNILYSHAKHDSCKDLQLSHFLFWGKRNEDKAELSPKSSPNILPAAYNLRYQMLNKTRIVHLCQDFPAYNKYLFLTARLPPVLQQEGTRTGRVVPVHGTSPRWFSETHSRASGAGSFWAWFWSIRFK